MSQKAPISSWKTPEVVAFLKENDLGALAPTFEENEVTGLDLLLLAEDELRTMLDISKLQATKIKNLVDSLDGAPAAAAAEEDPATSTDFKAAEVPHITDHDEDLGDDEEERAELRRAGTGVRICPTGSFSASAGTRLPAAPAAAVAAPTEALAGLAVSPAPPPPPAVGLPAVAPPPVAPPPGPLLPPGTGALRLDAVTVQRYQTCVATISQLEAEGVQQQLPSVRSRLAATKKRRQLQETKLNELMGEEREQNEKVEKLDSDKWYPGKYLFGRKKHDDKLARNTEKLEKVSSQVRAAGAQLEELHQQEAQQTNLLTEMTAKCASLEEARGFCASLLQSAFAGGAVGDGRENALETEVANLGPKLEEVRRYKAVYGKAYELLHSSREALDQARQLLQSASRLATVDVMHNFVGPRRGPLRGGPMIGNTPGGLMVDMVKRAQMRQGVQLCKTSGELAIKARALVPDMPKVKGEKLQKLRVGLGLMDVVFDNVISDLIVARKIRDMLSTVDDIHSDIKYAEKWMEGWIKGRIDQDLRNLEALLSTRRVELHNHRMALMQAWIEARSRGAVHEAPPPPQQPYFPPPQPVQPYPGVAMGVPAGPQYVL